MLLEDKNLSESIYHFLINVIDIFSSMQTYCGSWNQDMSPGKYFALNSFLLVSSVDNFFKQFGPRSGWTKCRAWSGSKLLQCSVRGHAVIISKYATKIVGMQNRQEACIQGSVDFQQMYASSIVKRVKTLEYWSFILCNTSKSQRDCYK